MTIERITDGFAIVHAALHADEVPPLLERHAEEFAETDLDPPKIEAFAREVVDNGFNGEGPKDLLLMVCEWGRGDRNFGRVEDLNDAEDVARIMEASFSHAERQDYANALKSMCEIKQIGRSFASKVLRFLLPGHAVIMDSVIRTRLGYPDSDSGYVEFRDECQMLLDMIRKHHADNGEQCTHRICDIEAALYTKIREQRQRP